jgi:hypothetical protein
VLNNPISRIDPFGLDSRSLCLNPANAAACVEASYITAQQGAAIERARNAVKGLAEIVAAAICGKDIDCKLWLTLLDQQYARLKLIESKGGIIEAEALEYNEMVDTFCDHCPWLCSKAKKIEVGKRIIH